MARIRRLMSALALTAASVAGAVASVTMEPKADGASGAPRPGGHGVLQGATVTADASQSAVLTADTRISLPDGTTVPCYTDQREGLAPLAPNELEQRKLAAAREAMDAADAAGRRWVDPVDSPERVAAEDSLEPKLRRLREAEPKPLSSRPGAPAAESGGAR